MDPEYSNRLLSRSDLSTKRSAGLVANEQDDAFRSRDIVREMVFDTAAGTHSGSGDDYYGSAYVVDRLRFVRARGVREVRHRERRMVFVNEQLHLFIE